MSKNSFVLYTEQRAILNKLTDEQAGKLIKAIYEYVDTGEIKDIDPVIDIVITPFITVLDKDLKKYEETKKKRAEAGAKGGKQTQANAKDRKQSKANQANASNDKQNKADENKDKQSQTNQAVYDNEYVNDNDNIISKEINKENSSSEEKSSTDDTAKASKKESVKHKYGEYKHVLLKDEELQNLKNGYSNWEELIKYLDEYIEMKGYKAKNHYLCIKKWVIDAVEKNQNNSSSNSNKKNFQNYKQREYNNEEEFCDNIEDFI